MWMRVCAVVLPLSLIPMVGCSGGAADEGAADAVGAGSSDAESVPAGPDEGSADPCAGVDCDDGLDCTTEQCADGACEWTLDSESCLIGGGCYADGAAGPSSCKSCDPAADPHAWTSVDEGTSCDSGDLCVSDAACSAGECTGQLSDCQDDDPCTVSGCDAQTGECAHWAGNDGDNCDAGPCAHGALCAGGVCLGAAAICNDGDPCTADSCDDGCIFVVTPGADCEDGDACTLGDTCDGRGACETGPEAFNCDDGNQCTLDVCDSLAGCAYVPDQTPCCLGEASICDDGNPCTEDLCDAATVECDHKWFEGPCDDGSACTAAGECAAGECQAPPIDCDDANPCTQDYCEAAGGCVNAPLSGSDCDDGLECSTGDQCLEGVCSADTSECECTPAIPPESDIAKVSEAQLGVDGHPGSGLDVDGDSETCQPASDCSGGVDNAFAPLAALANPALADAIADGGIVLILELPADKSSGELVMVIHQGQAVDPACDVTADVCDYNASTAGFDPLTCLPLFELPATLDGTKLTAGGPGSQLPFSVPVQGALLQVAIYDVRIEADLVLTSEGLVIGGSAVLGGALRKDVLLSALDEIDPDSIDLPIELVKTLLETVLVYDIDTTGDKQADAVSIGMAMQLIDGNLVGTSEPAP